jgi:hypothetical protein
MTMKIIKEDDNMTNSYKVLKDRQQEEVNSFPMVFAFSDEQFKEAMEKLGFSFESRDYIGNVVSIGGGGYIRKSDSEALHEMMDRHENELVDAIEGDETGGGFILDMFSYELSNHEYGYTREYEPALEALGLTIDDVRADDKLMSGFNLAISKFK